MNQTENISTEKRLYKGPLLDKEHGYYNSVSVMCQPSEVFNFCQDLTNVKKTLTDLPLNVENFLDLSMASAEQIGADEYKIVMRNNPESKTVGDIIFLISSAPSDRGTYLTAEAIFEKISWNDESPSTLMKVFLKRMKMLLETGEIATTKGQPSGREEVRQNQTLQ